MNETGNSLLFTRLKKASNPGYSGGDSHHSISLLGNPLGNNNNLIGDGNRGELLINGLLVSDPLALSLSYLFIILSLISEFIFHSLWMASILN